AHKALAAEASVANSIRVSHALKSQMQVETEFSADAGDLVREEYLTFVTDLAKRHPNDAAAVGECLSAHALAANSLFRVDRPDVAERLVIVTRDFIKSLDAENEELKKPIATANNTLNFVMRGIECERT